ncbi:hypothetical protein ACG7TL_007935 [Trametes sanguinea]
MSRPTTPDAATQSSTISPRASCADADDEDEGRGWSQGDTPPHMRIISSSRGSQSATDSDPDDTLGNQADHHSWSPPTWSTIHEDRLHAILNGPQYASGQPPRLAPLLTRFAPSFDLWSFAPFADMLTVEEECAVKAFREACYNAAVRVRAADTRSTVVEVEQFGVFGLMARWGWSAL